MEHRHHPGRIHAEQGFAALWMILMMMLLLGFAGFAIDLGWVNYTGHRAQRAADAAALGGAVFLPDEYATGAATAADIAADNDFTTGVAIKKGAKSNQLDVTVRVDTPSIFARLFGVNSFVVSRHATAEWLPPLGMGSPDAKLGNDPETGGVQPNFWVSQFGPGARKHDGDRYGADDCVDDSSDNHTPVYGCSSTANTRGNNTEFIPDGYRYAINVPASYPPGKDLVVEIFDPVLANVGARCNSGGQFPTSSQIWALSSLIPDAATRYRDGGTAGGLEWCTGDQSGTQWPDGYSGNFHTSTRFTVLTPERATYAGSATSNAVPTVMAAMAATATATTTTLPGPQPGPCPTGATAATLKVVNNRSTPVTVARLDAACNRVTVGVAAAGATFSVSGLDGERWQVLRNGDDLVIEDFTMPTGGITKTYTDPLPGTGDVLPGPCSGTGPTRPVSFVNNRSTALNLFWIDPSCVRQQMDVIAPGATSSWTTYDTHRWQVVDPATQAVIDDFAVDWSTTSRTYDPPTGGSASVSAMQSTTACEVTARSYELQPYTYSDPTSGTINQLLNPYDGVRDNGAGVRDAAAQEFALGFRRWVQICRIPAAQVVRGQYVLRIRQDLEEPQGGAGVNRMAMRSVWVDPFSGARTSAGLTMNALERFPVYVNFGGTTSSDLYMTRLTDIHAGRRLRVDLYDIGDTASGTVNLQFLPPPDAAGSAWTCSMTRVAGDGSTPVGSGCTLDNLTRADFNGTVVRINVDIPDDYNCDQSVATNCWTKMRMTFNGGAQPTDQTTWTAVIEGDPLRLVK